MTNEDLASWIQQNMTRTDNEVLSRHKETIAKLVNLGEGGKVTLIVDRTKLKADELIAVYFIGKLFAKIAGASKSAGATNTEVIRELGMPKGTVGRTVLELRKTGWLRDAGADGNEIVMSSIPSILKELGGVANG